MEAKRQATTLVHFIESLDDAGAEAFLRALIDADVLDREGRLRFAVGLDHARDVAMDAAEATRRRVFARRVTTTPEGRT